MEDKRIVIVNEGIVNPKDTVKVCIKSNESLTLKELSDVINLINKAFNDANRDNGIKNNAKLGKDYPSEVVGVTSGSIVLSILTNIVVPIAMGVLSNYIYTRLIEFKSKNDKKRNKKVFDQSIIIIVNGNENLIEINIDKSNTQQ